jgi:hypothetical protein
MYRWNVETCRSNFKKREGERKNNGEDESKQGILHTYTEISQ